MKKDARRSGGTSRTGSAPCPTEGSERTTVLAGVQSNDTAEAVAVIGPLVQVACDLARRLEYALDSHERIEAAVARKAEHRCAWCVHTRQYLNSFWATMKKAKP